MRGKKSESKNVSADVALVKEKKNVENSVK